MRIDIPSRRPSYHGIWSIGATFLATHATVVDEHGTGQGTQEHGTVGMTKAIIVQQPLSELVFFGIFHDIHVTFVEC